MVRPIEKSASHQHWLKELVNPLTKAERIDYVVNTIRRIFKFLQME